MILAFALAQWQPGKLVKAAVVVGGLAVLLLNWTICMSGLT